MKLAVIITGPLRYTDKVIEKLDEDILGDIEKDYFIHVWSSDDTNKKRDDTCAVEDLIYNKKIKSLIIDRAIDSDNLTNRYDDWTGTHSDTSAMFGMFIAIDKVLKTISNIQCYDEYTHVFRIRTDLVIYNDNFLNKVNFDSDKVYLSNNSIVAPTWVSDHLMLAKYKIFNDIWGIDNLDRFNKRFSRYARNPECYLSSRVSKYECEVVWERYLDYHVIYYPVRDSDPMILNDVISNQGINGIFKFNPYGDEVKILINEVRKNKENYSDYFKVIPSIKRWIKRKINNKVPY